eukprot:TRINITY_DN14390_c0_g1_i2.p1 TRINITY_DN14390_c0_g1~~TRINITY_DN14390_c0_g1_i2.p1  ORF type:complete len:208 (-),score=53.17 TRINITY_DN14390_c0_g1_i2:248-871(-)
MGSCCSEPAPGEDRFKTHRPPASNSDMLEALQPSTPPGLASHKKSKQLRGFVFVLHPAHGFLLLQAIKDKQMQAQIPGGRVDPEELVSLTPDRAAMVAAARELFEETGMDYRGERMMALHPLGQLRPHRYYFRLTLPEEQPELPTPGGKGSKLMSANTGECFQLCLSKEHVGFIFEKDPLTAADDIKHHSGGHNSAALRQMVAKRSP